MVDQPGSKAQDPKRAWLLGPVELEVANNENVLKSDGRFSQARKESTEINLLDWRWLADLSPGFPLHGSQIKILKSPQEFYSALVHRMESASTRISLASLYLGTGALEEKLVEAMKSSMSRNPSLNIKILLDYTRGSRGFECSSRTMLTPLIKDNDSCQVYLYHTPALRGLVKRWLPPRWNEVIGVQHMKIYIFDDDVIISGANLSNDYFTNRQDRYILLENAPDLANFFDTLISEVAKFSFKLDSSNLAHLNPDWSVHPSDGNAEEFISLARKRIVTHYENSQKNNPKLVPEFYESGQRRQGERKTDTWVFPLIQMGQLKIGYDNMATSRILADTPENSTIKLASGYFNLTSEYIDKIVQKSSANYQILMAHPKANGFYGAQGFSKGIPAGYTHVASNFFNTLKSTNQISRISMWEYLRASWTFHAKGLWYYPPGKKLPQVTLIGSPNFGYRSVYRDLEMQLCVITKNLQLRQELEHEQKVLFAESKPFNDFVICQRERSIPVWVRLVMRFFKDLF